MDLPRESPESWVGWGYTPSQRTKVRFLGLFKDLFGGGIVPLARGLLLEPRVCGLHYQADRANRPSPKARELVEAMLDVLRLVFFARGQIRHKVNAR